MKPVFAKKAARPDPELLTLKAELLEAQGDLAQAYRQFDQALDPELVESCVYQTRIPKGRQIVRFPSCVNNVRSSTIC